MNLADRRALPLICALGWALFYAGVALSNAADLCATAGWAVGWPSGAVDYVHMALRGPGGNMALAIAIVVLATLVQLASAVLYLAAARRVAGNARDAVATLRAATVPGVALWLFFAAGVELLAVFETVDWTKFLAMVVAQCATLLVSERALSPRD